MRSEEEMMNLFEQIVVEDERIRVSVLEGSRINKNISKDKYQDYDLSFFVKDVDEYIRNENWLQDFGESIFIQKPEDMELFEPELRNGFSYLIYFKDGVKIDLTLISVKEIDEYFTYSDGLVEILIDKDNRIKHDIVPNDQRYWIKEPTERKFDDCCNEFWHATTYVAKGLKREELLFAIDLLNQSLRPELLRMISWKIGQDESFTFSLGKNYKFINQYLSDQEWDNLMKTFSLTGSEEVLNSLKLCCQLFRKYSKKVSSTFSYEYPNYDENIIAYIQQVYGLYLNE